MTGVLHLLDLAGNTLAQLSEENERLREENRRLLDQLAHEPAPSGAHAVVDPRPVTDA